MDLFTRTVPEDEQHQNFRMIAQPGFCEPEIAVINDWAKGFVDRDGKFVKEFQTTFNSSFWELYLFACFKALNCKVDFKHAAPDFTVESPYGAFVAEATTANNPEGFRPEWERDISPETLEKIDLEEIVRLSTIRLANAITKKYRKYLSSYANLTHVQGKPFLICIAPFEQPFFFLQGDLALVRTLYAYDRPLLIPREKELLIVGESRSYRVQKHSGAEVPLGVFTNPGMADVSAVLFSSTATFGKVRALAGAGKYPIIFRAMRANRSENIEGVNWIVAQRPDYQETVLDGLHVCLNPFAKIPLDLRLFADRELTIHNYDPQTESYAAKVPDGFLYNRACMSVVSKNMVGEYRPPNPKSKVYREPTPESWPEAQLIFVGGFSGSFSDNHMAHYRGWTVVVSFDTIDKDWGTQAVNSLCFNLPQFIQANSNPDIASTGIPEWFVSKEEAFAAIKSKIDQLAT